MITEEQINSLPANHAMNVFMNEIIGAWGTTEDPPNFTGNMDVLSEQSVYFPDLFVAGRSALWICKQILILQIGKLNEEQWLDEKMIGLIAIDDWKGLADYMKIWR